MKKAFFALAMITSLLSCKKEEANPEDSWEKEKFKSDYTIQFPGYYTGGYIQGFEGPSFSKVRDDARVNFTYNFTNGLQSFEFGDTLQDEIIDSIWVAQGDLLMLLTNRLDIMENENIAGILFYNDVWSISMGELYWKDGGVFKDALTIHYANDLKDEAFAIVKTIKHN